MDANSVMSSWPWAIIVVPVAVGVFKAELGRAWSAWSTYRTRAFDLDGDPFSPNDCEMLNGATGQWGPAVIEKYVMWSRPSNWGVYVTYPDGGKEHFGYPAWASIRKRTPPQRVGKRTRPQRVGKK